MALACLLLMHPVSVEGKADSKPVVESRPTNTKAAVLNERINLARQLTRQKNFLGASAVLETLYEESPANITITNLLIQCYRKLKFYFKAEELTKRQIDLFPSSFQMVVRLAEFQIKQDKLPEGLKSYDRAIEIVQNGNVSRYRAIIISMTNHGLDEDASRVIKRLRKKLNNYTLFGLEKGTIFEKQREYELAAREYYPILSDSTRQATGAEKKLVSLLEFPESSPVVEKLLIARAEKLSQPRLLKLLSSHYLKSFQFDKAFDFAVRHDSAQGLKGTGLIEFMRGCRERELYSESIRMGRHILDNYSNIPIIPETYFLYAEALTLIGEYASAIEVYDTIVANLPRVQDKSEALHAIGMIYSENLNDCSRGLEHFDSVISYYQGGMGYLRAQLSRPDCLVRLERLKEAKTGYQSLLKRSLDEDTQEKIMYKLALLDFFEKKFDSSDVALHRLLIDYPRGYFVNDALSLILVTNEASGDKLLLSAYSNALLFEERRIPDSTRRKLMDLVEADNKSLADIALIKLSQLELNLADTAAVLEQIDRLEREYPDSYSLPYGLKTKADILLQNEESFDEAKDIYRRLLEEYSDYPFISGVRKLLRNLEEEIPVG